jgi:hypothetical protein
LRKYGVIPNRLLHHKISPRSIINKVFGFARQFQRRQKQRRNKVSETATTEKEHLRSVRPCITFFLLSGKVRTLISRTQEHTTAHNTLTHTLSPKKISKSPPPRNISSPIPPTTIRSRHFRATPHSFRSFQPGEAGEFDLSLRKFPLLHHQQHDSVRAILRPPIV